MSRQRIEAVVTEIAEPIAVDQQLELVDVEYIKEQGGYVLRVYIDKPDGVSLDDCQRMSLALSDRLDEVDPIPGSYALEVSSPGITRPLKKPADFERYRGQQVQIKTYAPIDGRKNWRGILLGRIGDDEIELQVDGVDVRLPFEMIAQARLDPDWQDVFTQKGKGGKKR